MNKIFKTTNGHGDITTVCADSSGNVLYVQLHPSNYVADKVVNSKVSFFNYELMFPWEVYWNRADNKLENIDND